ncbi:MAG: hypothetical protein D6690_11180 [Nitrospirae bacterium]|nr:MAG: hypothetical protein D6690_11180 [Nitrospirota bacterium]
MVRHPIRLHGLNLDPSQGTSRPTILQRTESDFIPAVLRDLQHGLSSLIPTLATTKDDAHPHALKLFQPIHRTFHLVVVEAHCDIPGRPRLDPQRIDSAGIVVRRIGRAPHTASFETSQRGKGSTHTFTADDERLEGWMVDPDRREGWSVFHDRSSEEWDPDAARRRELQTGHPVLTRWMLAKRRQVSEHVSPLFVAPPALCRALGKTILYGLVPVTNDIPHRADDRAVPSYSQEDVQLLREHLPPIVQPHTTVIVPRAGQFVTYADVRDETHAEFRRLTEFLGMVRQLAVEFDAFGPSPQAKAVLNALNDIALPFTQNTDTVYHPAGEFVHEVFRVLINAEGADRADPPSVLMPSAWPAVTPAQHEAIVSAVLSVLEQHLTLVAPVEGRFHERGRCYRLRTFVRVKHTPDCPPELIWSSYSLPFTIAPWFDANGEAAPVPVSLPDLDGGFLEKLKSLKPNVAFLVPDKLMNTLLHTSPKDFMEGSGGKKGPNLGLDWICGFNIPIITLCAFIVFNIFLQLFNIIFWWLPFVKICVPFPKKR